jgi:hypothetical protein
MEERKVIKEMKESGEYTDIEYHEYKGVHFFTAVYTQMKHIVVEPVHQEILDMLNRTGAAYDKELLWKDSGHSWADGLTFQGQRNRLIEYAHDDIDYIMNGQALKEQREDYLERRKRLREQYEFFKRIRRGEE